MVRSRVDRADPVYLRCFRMTHSLCRFVMAYSPRRSPAHSRYPSAFPTRSRPRQRSGRNLSLRYQQLETFVRSYAQKVALLAEVTDSSRLSLSAANESWIRRERAEMFHGLVIHQEPKPPESDGEFFTFPSTLSLVLRLKGLPPRVSYVRMRCLRL